jgi:Mg2+ and Co2+ transporter CorA
VSNAFNKPDLFNGFSGFDGCAANFVNNNMNVLLKNLTIINVIFLPLNLIAGIGGMSEFSMMTKASTGESLTLYFSLYWCQLVAYCILASQNRLDGRLCQEI